MQPVSVLCKLHPGATQLPLSKELRAKTEMARHRRLPELKEPEISESRVLSGFVDELVEELSEVLSVELLELDSAVA